MDLQEIIRETFPFYEDMEDIEVLQTASRRVGAEKAIEWADEHPKDNLVDVDKLQKWLNNNPPIKNKSVNEFYVNSLLKAMKGE